METLEYTSIQTDFGLLKWLDFLTENGVCLIRNAPISLDIVVKLSNRIRGVQSTIYGETFDVIATANPINVAYSPIPLELHLDLAYYESPPGLQLLHCVRFDAGVIGGFSTLADGFRAAEILRESDPAAFEALCQIPTTFHKV